MGIMGRGLSELQKYILITAAAKKTGDSRGAVDGRLYNADIFQGFYGWQPGWYTGRDFRPRDMPGVGSRNFQPSIIGQKKYDTTHVVVRKACARLERRDLVVCLMGAHSHWSGIEITNKGREVAASLLAKLPAERASNLANKVMVVAPDN